MVFADSEASRDSKPGDPSRQIKLDQSRSPRRGDCVLDTTRGNDPGHRRTVTVEILFCAVGKLLRIFSSEVHDCHHGTLFVTMTSCLHPVQTGRLWHCYPTRGSNRTT